MSCGKCNTCGKRMEPCPKCKGRGIYDGYSCKHCRGIGCICPKHGGYTGSSGGGCFITTAVMLATGKADDCTELNTFRHFRDNWLLKQSGGEKDIKEYYHIAPMIVDSINKTDNADDVYRDLWKKSLENCYHHILNGDYEKAMELYSEVVVKLKSTYLSVK